MDTICQGNIPPHVKNGPDTPLTIKHILTERPLLNNRKRQFFVSTNKTKKLLLNDGDTTYGDTIYNSVTNIDLLTKLSATYKSILYNYNCKKNKSKRTSVIINLFYDGVVNRQEKSMPFILIIITHSFSLNSKTQVGHSDVM